MLQWLRMMLNMGGFLLYIGALSLEERPTVIVCWAETDSAPISVLSLRPVDRQAETLLICK